MQIQIVEYGSAKFEQLRYSGYTVVETWTGADGVRWARMERR